MNFHPNGIEGTFSSAHNGYHIEGNFIITAIYGPHKNQEKWLSLEFFNESASVEWPKKIAIYAPNTDSSKGGYFQNMYHHNQLVRYHGFLDDGYDQWRISFH